MDGSSSKRDSEIGEECLLIYCELRSEGTDQKEEVSTDEHRYRSPAWLEQERKHRSSHRVHHVGWLQTKPWRESGGKASTVEDAMFTRFCPHRVGVSLFG